MAKLEVAVLAGFGYLGYTTRQNLLKYIHVNKKRMDIKRNSQLSEEECSLRWSSPLGVSSLVLTEGKRVWGVPVCLSISQRSRNFHSLWALAKFRVCLFVSLS